jgi:hypothetical protein
MAPVGPITGPVEQPKAGDTGPAARAAEELELLLAVLPDDEGRRVAV